MKLKPIIGSLALAALLAPAVVSAQSPAPADLTARCEQKKSEIDQRLDRITDNGRKHLDRFGDMAGRVETYYAGALQAEGVQVRDYDAQVQGLEAKRQAAERTLEAVANDELRCATVQASLARLRTDVAAANKAIKEYRAVVRALIVSVRTTAQAVKRAPTPLPSSTRPPGLP